jgi:hypothetical protein
LRKSNSTRQHKRNTNLKSLEQNEKSLAVVIGGGFGNIITAVSDENSIQ